LDVPAGFEVEATAAGFSGDLLRLFGFDGGTCFAAAVLADFEG
jgi:hypothetical protein